jgi:hypothetical protein
MSLTSLLAACPWGEWDRREFSYILSDFIKFFNIHARFNLYNAKPSNLILLEVFFGRMNVRATGWRLEFCSKRGHKNISIFFPNFLNVLFKDVVGY